MARFAENPAFSFFLLDKRRTSVIMGVMMIYEPKNVKPIEGGVQGWQDVPDGTLVIEDTYNELYRPFRYHFNVNNYKNDLNNGR